MRTEICGQAAKILAKRANRYMLREVAEKARALEL
jgi:hypothetical protein